MILWFPSPQSVLPQRDFLRSPSGDEASGSRASRSACARGMKAAHCDARMARHQVAPACDACSAYPCHLAHRHHTLQAGISALLSVQRRHAGRRGN